MTNPKTLELPITKTGRKYGYITWRKRNDRLVQELLGQRDHVQLKLPGAIQQVQHVDLKHRRISLGYKFTRSLSAGAKTYLLRRRADFSLHVSVR